jgi:nucleotide-binding universal stress UspA family protein
MSQDSPPITSVMVGDDGSSGARAALEWAQHLTTSYGARLTVVRATGDPPSVEPVRGELVHNEASLEVAGPPVRALLDAGRRLQVDLIAVGRRGAGGFSELRLGSTAHQLAEHSPSPIAVVPEETAGGGTPWPYSPLVVGVDGSPAAAASLLWAARIAAAAGGEIAVVHAVDFFPFAAASGLPQELYQTSLQHRQAEVEGWCRPLSDAGVAHRQIVAEGGPAGVILDAIDSVGGQLAVVGRRGQTDRPQLPMGSVAHRIIAFSPCPAVVVPMFDRESENRRDGLR